MAHILGIVGSLNIDGENAIFFKNTINLLIQAGSKTETLAFEECHGGIVGASFLLSRTMYRYPSLASDIISTEQLYSHLSNILSGLKSSRKEIVLGACIGIGETARYGPLSKSKDILNDIRSELKNLVKSSKEIKVQENAISALGHIVVGNPSFVHDTLEFIYTLPTLLDKQSEIHFVIGESFCTCAFGFSSTHMDEFIDIAATSLPRNLYHPLEIGSVSDAIGKILSWVTPSQSAVMKKAACIWLLFITKYCGTVPVVAIQLLAFHEAFSSLLGDKDGDNFLT